MEIKDLAGISEPLKRLIEVIAEGIGAISHPYLTKKNAEAKAYEIQLIANAISENKKLIASPEYIDGKISVLSVTDVSGQSENLSDRATQRLSFQESVKQQNIESVCANAVEELASAQTVPELKPEPEWISRFIDVASGISSEELQYLWGKILAGEIRSPGSFSLRTLDTLKNLSKTEAENFVKLANYVFKSNDKYFYTSPEDYIIKNNIMQFLDILALKDAGLIFETALEFSFSPLTEGQQSHLIYGSLILLFDRSAATPKLPLHVNLLTKIGVELLQLVAISPDLEYAKHVGFKIKHSGINFSIANIITIDESSGQIHFLNQKVYKEETT